MSSRNSCFVGADRVQHILAKNSAATIACMAIISLACSGTASADFTSTPQGLCYVNDVETTSYYTPGDVISTHCGTVYSNTTEQVQVVWVVVEILDESGNFIVDGGETMEVQPQMSETVIAFAETMVSGYYGETLKIRVRWGTNTAGQASSEDLFTVSCAN